jgi:hypothetical protein
VNPIDPVLSNLGELAAELFRLRLIEQGFRTSNRHVVDYLPPDVAAALFAGLLELTESPVTLHLVDDAGTMRSVTMRAMPLLVGEHRLDVLPYRVLREDDPAECTPNQGSEAYASHLRDHFAVGADHPRLLVVITSTGNETQKSAQDLLADQRLVSLDRLLQLVLDRSSVPPTSPLRTVARAFEAHSSDDQGWERRVEDFQAYVDAVADAPPEVQGEKLPMLGCFLADARADFVDGPPVQLLEDKDQRRRKLGDGRLFDNALLHDFLADAFHDPMVDPEHVLTEVLEGHPDKARELALAGSGGLTSLDLKTFAGIGQKKAKRQRNRFLRETMKVEGAAYYRAFGQGDETLLVVSANAPFTVTFELASRLVAQREHGQLGRWDAAKGKLDLRAIPTKDQSGHVTFALTPPEAPFSVWRLALTPGPRSMRSTLDEIRVVLYRSAAAEIVVEEGRQVSLEDQAWIAEGSRRFEKHHEAGTEPVSVALDEPVDATRDADARPIFDVMFEGSALLARVVDERPVETADDSAGEYHVEPLLEFACMTVRRGGPTTRAMRQHAHYLEAVREVHEVVGAGRYRVDLEGGDTREVWAQRESDGAAAPDAFFTGRAVGQLLLAPEAFRLDWDGTAWQPHLTPAAPPGSVQRWLDARRELLTAVKELAERRIPRFQRLPSEAAVPLVLLPLHQITGQVTALYQRWLEAVDDTAVGTYSVWHDVLLQTDTVRTVRNGTLERVVVLPTHPWLLGALHTFQQRFAANVRQAKESRASIPYPWAFGLTRADVHQMIPRAALEDWYVWQAGAGRLLVTDSAPFHLEFVPEDQHVHRATLDYVSRIVANKLGRYLRMHPHLRDHRRSLRIGFVNPGTGQHLLDGLVQWMRSTMQEQSGTVRELRMEQIPRIDVFLFAEPQPADLGSAFERFFQAQVSAADDDAVRNALQARIQYRFARGKGPVTARDHLHLCFLHGLVDTRRQQGKTALLGDGWDGAFDDGLQATWLRRTLEGEAQGSLRSRRGLWIDPKAEGLRGVLARVLALQRGCRDNDLSLDKGLYWETPLPDLRELGATYELSDWVVHLDRELSLQIFRSGASEDRPTIIEYSDQEVPESPGYDTITATRYATPYREQLGEILTLANLDVAGFPQEARTAANKILDDINVLSGSWALDFLMGSIADRPTSMRLKGNVGAALVYRWLSRMEGGEGALHVLETNVGPVVPVYVSLEDLLRATPAAGLKQRDGLVHRYTNEIEEEDVPHSWCDDLLVLYLPKGAQRGTRTRIFGRVIEVKFGTTAADSGTRKKAVEQVKHTRQLLEDVLSGNPARLDAPFRHKQLSLLVKAQLEQAVAMGAMSPEVYAFLDAPALSTNLATGRYEVDYTLGLDGEHLSGDAFLLSTATSDDESVAIEVVDGVRVLTVPRKLVEWLAFELADSPTLVRRPQTTLPKLGRYQSATTQTGRPRAGTVFGGAETPAPSSPAELEPEPTSEEFVLQAPPADRGQPLPFGAPAVAVAAPTSPTIPVEAPPLAASAPASTAAPSTSDDGDGEEGSLDAAAHTPVKIAPYPDEAVVSAVRRLEQGLTGHKVRLTAAPSARETDRGPRLLRVYVRLDAGESINAVRRISEDLARVVGTATSDIHITNVPERHAVGLDLPLPGLTYAVSFDDLLTHPSFAAAQRDLRLGFCCGIDVTGRAVWADLADMPHMLVAGTTGSGKTVFLRNVILTLLLNNAPTELVLRLSSSKPMDFRIFTQSPHAADRPMATDPLEARHLADELVQEMDRRYGLIDAAMCDNLAEFNRERPSEALPYIVAVFDEYAEMVASFGEKSERDAFESAVGRLAQKARAAGIHLIICMQRPDANALKGAIKANILHRFALKLPQNHDSRIILDETGAETLLGQGDLLYKDANSRMSRLQVPFLENTSLKRHLKRIVSGDSVRGVDETQVKACPKCGESGTIGEKFGVRRMKQKRADGTEVVVTRPQSYCKSCRGPH